MPKALSFTRDQWIALFEEQKTSSLPLATFCAQKGFSATAFRSWKSKILSQSPAEQPLVEVRAIPPGSGGPHLHIELRNGVKIHFPNTVSEPSLYTLLTLVARL